MRRRVTLAQFDALQRKYDVNKAALHTAIEDREWAWQALKSVAKRDIQRSLELGAEPAPIQKFENVTPEWIKTFRGEWKRAAWETD